MYIWERDDDVWLLEHRQRASLRSKELPLYWGIVIRIGLRNSTDKGVGDL